MFCCLLCLIVQIETFIEGVIVLKYSLFHLAENGFTQHDMALMLGVSKRTIENRFSEFNLTNRRRFSDIDDQSLDVHVQRIVSHFPRSGI